MNRVTASKTFYDKGLNPRQLIYRGESFPVSEVKASELIRAGLARAGQDYDKKIVEPETKEEPISTPNPEADPEPVEEKEPEAAPDPEPEKSKYEEYTVDELKKMVRDRGIVFPNNARKADLIAILEGADSK